MINFFSHLPISKTIMADLARTNQPWNINQTRKNNLDFMRFFFAVMVIFSHSFILINGSNSTEPFWLGSNGQLTGGYLAVAFFFIVSEFLITQSWMNSSGIFSFFRKRILRIYPAFIVASLVCVLFVSALGSTQPAKIFSNFSIVILVLIVFFFICRQRMAFL